MIHAWPYSEVLPITCQSGTFELVQIPGLTLIDALDTILLMQNVTEFARAVERIRSIAKISTKNEEEEIHHHTHHHKNAYTLFDLDQNVSVFETNIRVLGGLLSAHQMAISEPFRLHQIERIPWHHVFIIEEEEDGTTTSSRPRTVVRWGPVPECSSSSGGGSDMDDFTTSTTTTTSPSMPPNEFFPYGQPVCSRDLSSVTRMDCAMPTISCSLSSTTPSSANNHNRNNNNNQTCSNSSAPTTTTTKYWKYDGLLLRLAWDLGERLYPALNTSPTGIPYGTVHLQYGVPPGETPVASLAGAGTLVLEFETLSRWTGDAKFGRAAKLAMRALFAKRNQNTNLFGKHVDIRDGKWTETLSGIGSNSDSFYEYLAKMYVLFPEEEDFWIMAKTAYEGVFRENRLGEWYMDADMHGGGRSHASRKVLESLAAFYPGLQVLLGEVTPAARSLNSFFLVREWLGFLPERFHYGHWVLDSLRGDGAGRHPLRPELLESCYFLHRATKRRSGSSSWQWAADFALSQLESMTRTQCGYAGLRELHPHTTGAVHHPPPANTTSTSSTNKQRHPVKLLNEMPSFFLSETLKYLYLTFDDDNFLHNDDDQQWIFTTEAHPLHYVPPPQKKERNNSNTAKFSKDLEALKQILRSRLRANAEEKSQHRPDPFSQIARDLKHEKWSSKVPMKAFRDDLRSIMNDSVQFRQNSTADSMMSPFVSPHQTIDMFGETLTGSNAAHVALRDLGLGANLQRACPNTYGYRWWWQQALNGGAIDYTDVYVSVVSDVSASSETMTISHFTQLGAADAIGALGSGVYVGERDDDGLTCPIDISGSSSSDTEEKVSQEEKTEATGESSDSNISNEMMSLSEKIGPFEVSKLPGGSGFSLRRIRSGEYLATSIVYDLDEANEPLTMVYSSLLRGSDPMQDPHAKVQANEARPQNDEESLYHRRLMFADFDDNVFSCEVNIIRTKPTATSLGDDFDDSETLLWTMPCAPAMFGPSRISILKEQERTIIEAVVVAPGEDNHMGCRGPPQTSTEGQTCNHSKKFPTDVVGSVADSNLAVIESDSFCKNSSIHVVQRGGCTFFKKAINMQKMWGADAVIVVNSPDDEFFLMSGVDETKEIDSGDVPLTVLISASDGENLLSSIINRDPDDEEFIFARIAIQRRQQSVNREGKIINAEGEVKENDIYWPVVISNRDSLHILAENDWGIQATSQGVDWQLKLVMHSNSQWKVENETS
jgi:mannosidase alpha-like ER degradation enhancer 2